MATIIGREVELKGYGSHDGKSKVVKVVGLTDNNSIIVLQFESARQPGKTMDFRFRTSDGNAVGAQSESGFRIPLETLQELVPAYVGSRRGTAQENKDMAAATATAPAGKTGTTKKSSTAGAPAAKASTATATPAPKGAKAPETIPATSAADYKFMAAGTLPGRPDQWRYQKPLPEAPKGTKVFRLADRGYFSMRDLKLFQSAKDDTPELASAKAAWQGAINKGWIYVYLTKAQASAIYNSILPQAQSEAKGGVGRTLASLATQLKEEFGLKARGDLKYALPAHSLGLVYGKTEPGHTGSAKIKSNGTTAATEETEETEEEEEETPAPAPAN